MEPISNKPVLPPDQSDPKLYPQILNAPSQAEITPDIKRKRSLKSSSGLISVAIITIVTLWLVLTYVVGFTDVNGISMQPTFHTGNILIVWKLPQTWAKISGGQYIPSRGSIVIIDDTNNSSEQFVKRVIGLPNERIAIANGQVNLYNSTNPRGFDPDSAPYGKSLIQTQGTFNGTVGAGEIFVMGDNRAAGASIDSRSSLGNVPSSYIVGQVIVKIFPLNEIKLF